jgi:hypothetical protein
MVAKKTDDKKKGTEEKKDVPARFVPPQVVEVVEDDNTSINPLEKTEKNTSSVLPHKVESNVEPKIIDALLDDQDVTTTSDDPLDLEEDIIQTEENVDEKKDNTIDNTSISTSPDELEAHALDRQKEVVKELFKKKETLLDSEISIHEKKGSIPLVMWVVIVLTVAFLVSFGIIFAFRGGTPNISVSTGVSPTSTVAPTAAITPTPEVNKKDLKIQVLNGNGEKGVASAMKTVLESKGYTVTDTGNAGTYDYENTEIQVKTGKEQIAETLKTDLTGKYEAVVSDKKLDASSVYDIRIIVGKK